MGTRSNIYIETDPKTYLGTYCHYDGYPKHMFPTLSGMGNDELLGHILTAMIQGGLRGIGEKKSGNSTEYLGDYSCTHLLASPQTDEGYGVEFIYVKRLDGKVMWRHYSESEWLFKYEDR